MASSSRLITHRDARSPGQPLILAFTLDDEVTSTIDEAEADNFLLEAPDLLDDDSSSLAANFTGSVVAFSKLAGMMSSKALALPGRDQLNDFIWWRRLADLICRW